MGDLTAVAAQVEQEVRRVSERLRTLPAAQLAQPAEGPRAGAGRWSRAAAARAAAQALADVAAGLEQRAAPAPTWRTVPRLSADAAGDQVAVTGRDVVAAAAGVAAEERVWARDQRGARRTGADEVLMAVLDELRGLRRTL